MSLPNEIGRIDTILRAGSNRVQQQLFDRYVTAAQGDKEAFVLALIGALVTERELGSESEPRTARR